MMTIRAARIDDAVQIERLYNQSADYLRALGDTTAFQCSAAVYVRDGFGPYPAFAGIVAAHTDTLVGYVLYTFGYGTDRAIRSVTVLDLLVDEAYRGQGLGRRLMDSVAALGRDHGAAELLWAVYKDNHDAIAFYERLGAQHVADVRWMYLPL